MKINSREERINKVIYFIRKNYRGPITLGDLAKIAKGGAFPGRLGR